MSIDPSEASASLQEIAAVERRTRQAVFYAGSSAIFIMWGLLVAFGYGLAELYPQSARTTWLVLVAAGCAATAFIAAMRLRPHPREERDWRIVWAMVTVTLYGAIWAYFLGPIVPRPMMYAFQPSLCLLCIIVAGLWLGRVFLVVGFAGILLMLVGYLQAEPWLRLWMASVQSGTLILGGVWLHRHGLPR